MARRAYTIVGTASAAIMTAVVAASVQAAPILGAGRHRVSDSTPTETTADPPAGSATAGGGIPAWITIGATVLLALYAVSLFLLVALSSRDRADPDDDAEVTYEESPPVGDWRVVLPVDLRDAAAGALGRLHEGTPRNAIVACWVGLRTATFRCGLAERPADSPQEYVVRAVHGLGLDPSAIQALATLFREARFSEHPMSEGDRDRAGLALRMLVDELDERGSGAEPVRLLEATTR